MAFGLQGDIAMGDRASEAKSSHVAIIGIIDRRFEPEGGFPRDLQLHHIAAADFDFKRHPFASNGRAGL